MYSKFIFILKLGGLVLSLISQRLSLFLSAKIQRLTYTPASNSKNIVVIGGSFAGYLLAKQLSESLPSGYRVILIEKHSHFHFTWNFPRVTVLQGHEQKAFVPYPAKPRDAPQGVYLFKQGNVISISAESVNLQDGQSIPYEYLAIATGSQRRYPASLDANEKVDCMHFFADQQESIKTARKIVVVGGGAAGVEVTADIKSKYPEKDVCLVHSRDRLLNSFEVGLHTKAKVALEELGVKLHLGVRVINGLDLDGPSEMTLQDGQMLACDLLVSIPSLPLFPSPSSNPNLYVLGLNAHRSAAQAKHPTQHSSNPSPHPQSPPPAPSTSNPPCNSKTPRHERSSP
jgi:apoptosis-inducing factor 2